MRRVPGSRNPPAEQMFRALRSMLLIVVFTVGALSVTGGNFSRPRGNPLLYALAMSWLISFAVAMVTSGVFRVNVTLFPLARWEKDGEVYDGKSLRAFRRLLRHSPLGWINPNFHRMNSRCDCERLLKEMNAAEGVHWLTCVLAIVVAISYVVRDDAAYGYAMLLVRIPFDLYPIMLQRWNRGRLGRVLNRRVRVRV